ncbi:DMT family transporter [Streptomyces sp. NBC_01142]|uniref:DMT family transporter n=1 Tax=Streptomyces sp. NBC_01142 TaxID=2975865 RepID=UPI00224E78E6|nr:DMT family transporter [Streptomyces sp. NBC_01142]MCX4822018.1 DMT family transporter [Streptomyces sp. NBC_01142]
MTNSSPPAGRSQWPALAAAGVTVVLWASAFVSIRSAGDAYSPGALALGRLLAGSLALGCVLLIRREGLPPRAAWPGIAVSGLLWFGVYMVVLNWGEQQVDAGTAAMVVNIGPILIALLGARLLGEALPPRLLAGMAVSFAGAVTVGLSMSGRGGASTLGVLLCLLAAVGYAAGVVGQKPALAHASALQVTTFGCLVGTVACLPFAGQLIDQAGRAPMSATLNMVYLGVFPTALAFTTWAYALARTTAGRMGATTYAVPALVVLMSWLALDEVPGLLTLAGGALCLAGVAVSRSRSRKGPGAGSAAEVSDQQQGPDQGRGQQRGPSPRQRPVKPGS